MIGSPLLGSATRPRSWLGLGPGLRLGLGSEYISPYLPISPYISLYLPTSPYTCDLERRCSMVSVISALLRRYCSGTWGDMGRCGVMWGDVGRRGEMWGDMGGYLHRRAAAVCRLALLVKVELPRRVEHKVAAAPRKGPGKV